jgi:hypothetical protein
MSWQALTERVRGAFDAELGLSVAFVRSSNDDGGIDGSSSVCAVDDAWKDRIRAAVSSDVAPSSPGPDSAPRLADSPLSRRTSADDLVLPDLLVVTVIERGRKDRPPLKRFVASASAPSGPAMTLKQHLRDQEAGTFSSTRAETCAEAFTDNMGTEITETNEGMSDEVG